MAVGRRAWFRRTAGAVATAAAVLLAPATTLASHGINGTPDWMIPWYATAVLMIVPYLGLAAVAAVVYRHLRREF